MNQNPVSRPYIHQSDLPPHCIRPKHIQSGYAIIKYGLSADRPTEGTADVILYIATDTGVLSLWNGTSWLTVTLS